MAAIVTTLSWCVTLKTLLLRSGIFKVSRASAIIREENLHPPGSLVAHGGNPQDRTLCPVGHA
ncbi:hypothetical protein NIES267_62330 [Calothrix parasitica NIES-267]|uniref:Uncharacterized protein n=1 Tax=Calothrix parasitica NIES-267 TaxID=1973488 RepID=A0A1Z4LZQ6_9CYAN|nr:hypothetical protein NIES267_62330 [Calothrix parasitica NIES-267]